MVSDQHMTTLICEDKHTVTKLENNIRGVFEKKRDCVCCMNMLYSSNKNMVVLRSTILGSCTNESSALCNNHTLFRRFFYSGTSVKFVSRLLKKIVILVLRSTILGSCTNESSALCTNHTLFRRFFYSGTSVKFVLR